MNIKYKKLLAQSHKMIDCDSKLEFTRQNLRVAFVMQHLIVFLSW